MLPLLILLFAALGAFLAYKTLFGAAEDYERSRKPKKKYTPAELEEADKLIKWLSDPKEDAKLINNRQKRRKFLKDRKKRK